VNKMKWTLLILWMCFAVGFIVAGIGVIPGVIDKEPDATVILGMMMLYGVWGIVKKEWNIDKENE